MRIVLLVTALLAFSGAPAAAVTAQRAPQTDAELKLSYAPTVKKAAPAVVNIYTKKTVRTRTRSVFDDPFFRDFFGSRGGGMTRERVARSLGSGVIVDPSGVVVTNNHVVDGAEEILVVLADRREFEAEVVLTDPQTDLAVLRVDAEDLPSLGFANSDRAEVGDVVLAIGNPFGVGQTVTSGIVSAVSRSATSVSDYQFFIQTDAAINPGNSGGALVTAEGELLGVNTAIYSRSGGSNGIGFAIPGNLVRQVVDSAIGGETMVRRPWLGLAGDEVDGRIASAVGLDRPRGVIVTRIYPGGPADQAGVEEGDVVLSIAGQDIFEAEALRYRLATFTPGERVELTVLRDGRERTLRARLDLPPDSPARDTTALKGLHPLSGATVANLSPALAEELGRDPLAADGVVVTEAAPGSPAARYGLGRGTLILGLNGDAVENVRGLQEKLAEPVRGYVLQVRAPNGRLTTLRIAR